MKCSQNTVACVATAVSYGRKMVMKWAIGLRSNNIIDQLVAAQQAWLLLAMELYY